MQFLAKHYEKIILAFLLFLFAVSMIYLVGIISSAAELKMEQLEIKPREADWKQINNIDFKGEDFVFGALFMRNTIWHKSVSRQAEPVFSDLVVMAPCMRCPHCGGFIPTYYVYLEDEKKRECPLCKAQLPIPDNIEKIDPDSLIGADLIPLDVKLKYGIDPKDPRAVHYDLDGDGFSNLFEYQQNTALDNARNHPPMYMRLYMSELRQSDLDPMLMKVSASGASKENWDIQVNVDRGGNTKTRFLVMGDNIQLEPKRSYKIVDVISDIKTVKEGNVEVQRDESKIVCESNDDKKLRVTMTVGKVAYSPLPKAFLKDIADDNVIMVDVDDKFRIGNSKTGVTEYTVKSIDADKHEAEVVSRRHKGVIGKEPMYRLIKQVVESSDGSTEGIPSNN